MRPILIACITVLVTLVAGGQSGHAREYPWCARYDWTTYNCGFVSYQQCMATVTGSGGWCERNPRYSPPPRKPRRY